MLMHIIPILSENKRITTMTNQRLYEMTGSSRVWLAGISQKHANDGSNNM